MNLKKILRILILLSGYLVLIFGLYSGILIVTGGLFSVVEALVVCALPILAIYSFFLYPIVVVAMVLLHKKNTNTWLLPIVLGIIILIFNFLPFAGMSSTIAEGNTQFNDAFGPNWMSKIPENLTSKF